MGADLPETASENPNGFVGKCDVATGPVPTDSDPGGDQAKVKKALGELGEVTGVVEAMVRLLADEREKVRGRIRTRMAWHAEQEQLARTTRNWRYADAHQVAREGLRVVLGTIW